MKPSEALETHAAPAADPTTPPMVRHDLDMLELIEASVDALVTLRPDGRVRYLNAMARRRFGATISVGDPWPYVAACEPGEACELTIPDESGTTRFFTLRTSATRWRGDPIQVLVLRDETERRTAEQALVLGRRAMEASSQGMVIADAREPGHPLIYVNPAFEQITGYSRGEALGRSCAFLQGSERQQPELLALQDALARGEGADVVLRNFRKNGEAFWNELSVSPVRNADGKLTHFVGILNDISERRRLEDDRLRRSTHDPLTGLPNRKLLLDLMQQALEVSGRYRRSAAALQLHLPHVEEVNDSLGHEMGERLLLAVASRLKSCLRPGDTVCRLTGTEFIVFLPDLAVAEDAASMADRLLQTLSPAYEIDDRTLYCGCSIGVAIAEPGTDAAQLLQQCGVASHAAKRAGHDGVHYYSDEVSKRVTDRLELRTSLQGAIGRGELALHYQPQVDARSDRVSGVEVLLRWQHPELGSVSPVRFIPIAEETGLIVPIGEWVMEQACRQHKLWIDAGMLDCAVSVNVSGVQFQRQNFVDMVREVLQRTGLPAHRLELELTESVTMDTGATTLARLQALRALGITLSIDDFGTGFSSLGYLKRLPIDKVKIDRSFVSDITHDSDAAAITLSIISIAHNLRLQVVAEGVETAAQLAFLKRHRCDGIQGYFFSRPLPCAEFESFLQGYTPADLQGDGEQGGARPTVLLVDDEPNVLRALNRLLRRDGYRILTADSAAAAFDVLAQHDVHVILSDQRMPQMCGTDFLQEVKSLYPQTVRIVLSGYTDLQTVTQAINRGAIYRFLTKPWEDDALRAHIKEAFMHHRGGQVIAG